MEGYDPIPSKPVRLGSLPTQRRKKYRDDLPQALADDQEERRRPSARRLIVQVLDRASACSCKCLIVQVLD